MTKNKYIIPHYLLNKDYYCKKPDWYRRDGGKFVINDQLLDREMDYVISQGLGIIRVPEATVKKNIKPRTETEAKDKITKSCK